jgi:uncharacterized SAM-binding protein YcdF (DUF218 family)
MELNELKPLLSALVMPPTLGLLAIAAGAGLRRWAHARGGALAGLLLLMAGWASLWLGSCEATALWLQDHVLRPPPALSAAAVRELKADAARRGAGHTAIVVLGGGRQRLAPEYGEAMLTENPLARLHYGVRLAQATGLPLAYTGGVGWAQTEGPSEARTAATVSKRDYGVTIRWLEDASRDTRENARFTVDLLLRDGVEHVVVVTHASHMPRAVRAFTQAAAKRMTVAAAPMGFVVLDDRPPLPWLPSARGFAAVHAAWHEMLGLLLGR